MPIQCSKACTPGTGAPSPQGMMMHPATLTQVKLQGIEVYPNTGNSLKISLKSTKQCSTGVNNLASDLSTRLGRVPALASWYHQDIKGSTKGFIHSMFGSDTKIRGKMGRCAVLGKNAFFLDISHNQGNANANKPPSQNAPGSTSSEKVIMTLHSPNLMMSHKHPLA